MFHVDFLVLLHNTILTIELLIMDFIMLECLTQSANITAASNMGWVYQKYCKIKITLSGQDSVQCDAYSTINYDPVLQCFWETRI